MKLSATKEPQETEQLVGRKPVEILLVEDNQGDVVVVEEALKEYKTPVNLNVIQDGAQAIAYLRKEGPHANAVTPDLVILDINLPKKNGHEVLREIRSTYELKNIPVVVLTTSNMRDDIAKSYQLGATRFITKPFGFHLFLEAVRTIENFLENPDPDNV